MTESSNGVLRQTTTKMKQKRDVVKGRLPDGGKIYSTFENGIITVSDQQCPHHFFIEIDTSQLNKFSETHRPTSGLLEIEGQPAALEAKYEAGVIRYDSSSVPEFWLEVRVRDLKKKKKLRIDEPTEVLRV